MSISQADIERVLTLISESDVNSFKAEDFDQFQYQGFDPKKIAESLLKVKKEKSVADSDFKKDVVSMVAIGMIKGSVNPRNKAKMSPEGQTDLDRLGSTYGIKEGGGRGQASGIVTYPRVMATFPDIAIRLTKIIGGKEFRGGPLLSTRLPSYMQVQVFPSILPRDLDAVVRKMLLTASLCYSIDQTIQISEMKDPDLKVVASTQSNFVQVGHTSPVPSDKVRKDIFKSLSIHESYDSIRSVLETYKNLVDPSFLISSQSEFVSSLNK